MRETKLSHSLATYLTGKDEAKKIPPGVGTKTGLKDYHACKEA